MEYDRPRSNRKKTDLEALNSSLMRIPRMKTDIARDLIDIGLREVYELIGRAPETLFAELKKLKPEAPDDRLPYFRMAVYYAETDVPEPKLMHPSEWT